MSNFAEEEMADAAREVLEESYAATWQLLDDHRAALERTVQVGWIGREMQMQRGRKYN